MLIRKTTLIQFDDAQERNRLISVFKGQKQKEQLEILDAFVKGDWGSAISLVRKLPRESLEYIHWTVFDVLKEIADTEQRKAAFAEGYSPDENLINSAATAGVAVGIESADYPKFEVIR